MLSMRRIAVAAATGGLLVAGTVTALTLTSGTAKADNVGNCTPTVAALGNCSLDLTVASPPAFGGLEITVASSPGGRQSIEDDGRKAPHQLVTQWRVGRHGNLQGVGIENEHRCAFDHGRR